MYYTSYFGKLKKIDRSKYNFVAITNSRPAFCDENIGDWCFLGPSKELLQGYKAGNISKEEYTQIYNQFLKDNWSKFKDVIERYKDENIVMLCYEKSTDFCHRHLLRKFLNEVGIKCEELE